MALTWLVCYTPIKADAETSLDGVYYIKNLYSSKYLHARGDGVGTGTVVEQYTKDTALPTINDPNRLSQLWKIKPLGTNLYSIRPMHKLDRALTYVDSGAQVSITTASTSDSSLSDSQKWLIIEETSGQYSIQPYLNLTNGNIEVNSNTGSDEGIQLNSLIFDGESDLQAIPPADVELTLSSNTTTNGSAVFSNVINSLTRSSWTFEVGTSSGAGIWFFDGLFTKSNNNQTEYWLGVSSLVSKNLTEYAACYAHTTNEQNIGFTFEDATVATNTGNAIRGLKNGESTVLALRPTGIGSGESYRLHRINILVSSIAVSGYELDYQPNLWNTSTIQPSTNCYSYALNTQVLPSTNELVYLQPGFYSTGDDTPTVSASEIERLFLLDAEEHGTIASPISAEALCRTGTYKVALVIGALDYHWYRQNPDGSWSHKTGQGAVSNVDASGDIIYDPRTCDRSYFLNNYHTFVGFYEIEPWNYMYEGN